MMTIWENIMVLQYHGIQYNTIIISIIASYIYT